MEPFARDISPIKEEWDADADDDVGDRDELFHNMRSRSIHKSQVRNAPRVKRAMDPISGRIERDLPHEQIVMRNQNRKKGLNILGDTLRNGENKTP